MIKQTLISYHEDKVPAIYACKAWPDVAACQCSVLIFILPYKRQPHAHEDFEQSRCTYNNSRTLCKANAMAWGGDKVSQEYGSATSHYYYYYYCYSGSAIIFLVQGKIQCCIM